MSTEGLLVPVEYVGGLVRVGGAGEVPRDEVAFAGWLRGFLPPLEEGKRRPYVLVPVGGQAVDMAALAGFAERVAGAGRGCGAGG